MEVTAIQGYFENGFFHKAGKRVNLPGVKLVNLNDFCALI